MGDPGDWMTEKMKDPEFAMAFIREWFKEATLTEKDLMDKLDKAEAALAAMTRWLEKNQPDVWRRGILEAVNEAQGKEVGGE